MTAAVPLPRDSFSVHHDARLRVHQPQQVHHRLGLFPLDRDRPHSPPTQQANRRAIASGTHTSVLSPFNAWLAPMPAVVACAPLGCLFPGTEISVHVCLFLFYR
jgi:hypothetical protein